MFPPCVFGLCVCRRGRTSSVFEIIVYLIETVGPVVVDKLEDIKFIFIAYFLGLVAYEVIESFLPPLKATKLGKKVGLLFKSLNTKKEKQFLSKLKIDKIRMFLVGFLCK